MSDIVYDTRTGTASSGLGIMSNHPSETEQHLAWDFFVAYPGERRHEAESLVAILRQGGSRAFWDGDIARSDAFSSAIPEALLNSRVIVVLLGENLDPRSCLADEIAMAVDVARKPGSGRRVVPVYLDGRPARMQDRPYGLVRLPGIDVCSEGGLEGAVRLLHNELRSVGDAVVVAPLTLLPHEPAADRQRRTQLYDTLCRLTRPQFESVVHALGVPHQALAPFDAPQSQRVLDALLYCTGVDRPGLADVQLHLEAMKRGFRATLKEFALHALSVCLPPLYERLVCWGLVAPPPGTREIEEYLDDFVTEMTARNDSGLVYVPLRGAPSRTGSSRWRLRTARFSQLEASPGSHGACAALRPASRGRSGVAADGRYQSTHENRPQRGVALAAQFQAAGPAGRPWQRKERHRPLCGHPGRGARAETAIPCASLYTFR